MMKKLIMFTAIVAGFSFMSVDGNCSEWPPREGDYDFSGIKTLNRQKYERNMVSNKREKQKARRLLYKDFSDNSTNMSSGKITQYKNDESNVENCDEDNNYRDISNAQSSSLFDISDISNAQSSSLFDISDIIDIQSNDDSQFDISDMQSDDNSQFTMNHEDMDYEDISEDIDNENELLPYDANKKYFKKYKNKILKDMKYK